MDNITHSLAGLVVAEAAVQLRARLTGAEPSRRFRTIAAISSLVAANLPDADLLFTGLGGDRLAYMLHHRGYTHTVVVALLGALVVWGLASLAWRWRTPPTRARGDAGWLLALLVVSAISHLLLDWTNSYGIHPFWPFDDHWIYGDSVFIVEPWLWVVSVPVLVRATTSRVARVLLSLVLLIGLALAWRVTLVSSGAAAALTAGAVASIAVSRMTRPPTRAAMAAGGWVLVTLVLMAGAAHARAATMRAFATADPLAELLDVVVSPLPANAVCMTVITVERVGGTYRVVMARASAAPWITPASRCSAGRADASGFGASARRSTPAVKWDAEWSAPVAELAALARTSCAGFAALQFMRVPVWRSLGDSTVLLGDARYGGASGSGFTAVRVAREAGRCARGVPPWVPPRADVLALGGGA